MTDHRDELIEMQRKHIALQERYIALLVSMLAACKQPQPAPQPMRKDVQA